MITIKKEKEIELMRVAGSITAGALDEISKHIKPGISTLELDKIANKLIIDKWAKPAFLRYSGFPNSICASIDDVVVHGIPKQDIVLEEGQIIGIDVGAKFGGYCGDAAAGGQRIPDGPDHRHSLCGRPDGAGAAGHYAHVPPVGYAGTGLDPSYAAGSDSHFPVGRNDHQCGPAGDRAHEHAHRQRGRLAGHPDGGFGPLSAFY